MRFIDGETFKDAVHGFHAADPAAQRSGERVLGFRGLLNRLVQVCHTIDYAHSRGVLHRDIKPSNVMLGPYGETLVVDWGLAKVIREPGEGRQAGGQAESVGPAPAVAASPSGTPVLEGDQGTIDYSHSRDANHGDVKPDDNSLGKDGETLDLGRGLAIPAGPVTEVGNHEEDLGPISGVDHSALTLQGSCARDARVHEPRAGGRRPRPAGSGQRHLQLGERLSSTC